VCMYAHASIINGCAHVQEYQRRLGVEAWRVAAQRNPAVALFPSDFKEHNSGMCMHMCSYVFMY
jgi:hypothetical protein